MASSNTCLLNSAYSYKGKLEEFSIPKKSKNNDAFRKKVINAFFEAPLRPYAEFLCQCSPNGTMNFRVCVV